MKTITLIVFAISLSTFAKIQAQCNNVETLTICDMTTIDGDSDGNPDGIINLYESYNNLTGASISLATGIWVDPNFNFALNELTGDLFLWDLANSSESVEDYQFQLIDSSSGCPDGILIRFNIVIGPFSGIAVPPLMPNDVNVQVCDIGQDPCGTSTNYDLYTSFLSGPTAHLNGIWRYEGSSPYFSGIMNNRYLLVDIPYQQGPPLVDDETFELIYSVPGITPCAPAVETRVKISVVREVFSGAANHFNICETEMIRGDFTNLDLRDDDYLVNEDIEGVWLYQTDPTGQINSPDDSQINLKNVYDNLYATNQRFGCATYTYSYFVESRSTICESKTSSVTFRIYEYLRPFQQSGAPPEFCVGSNLPSAFNLYDLLEFTTENGVLYRYPPKRDLNGPLTAFTQVSGPSTLPLNDFTGSVNLSGITNAAAGTYVFEYTVSKNYHCSELDLDFVPETIHSKPNGCNFTQDFRHPCQSQRAQIMLVVHPILYAGEDTTGLMFCENDPIITSPLDLFTLVDTNGVDDPIYQGANGTWTDNLTGNTVTNPINLPQINNVQTFDFTYSTVSSEGCLDSAKLIFDVYEEYSPGVGDTIEVCNTDVPFDLFNQLSGDPNNTGVWSGPNGFLSANHNAIFDPSTDSAGDYVYTVPDNPNNDPDNILCSGSQVTLIINLSQSPNAGNDMFGSVCRSDSQIDLIDYLDPSADTGGTFVDLDNTNALSGSVLNISQLNVDTYHFQYEIQGSASCSLAISVISITVEELPVPTTSNQTFCASDGATISDLTATGGMDFNWYNEDTSLDALSQNIVLEDGEDYYVSALDSNGCESDRVVMIVTILPLDHVDCDDCIKDGISVNGDGENEEFELCNLPVTFPDFEIIIFNRYGTKVYVGNKNTPLFKGESNVSLTIGRQLPTGIYFYVFEPNDGKTAPFQGNFYLSR